VTIDEELNLLESNLRRLKIEYEVYFNSPNKRPPSDLEWRVANALRKFSDGYTDGGRLSLAQRYRYNEMAQRYAVFADLWRKKMRIREEGYRRPQDALLSVQGVRAQDEGESTSKAVDAKPKPFMMQCSDPLAERDKVQSLFNALAEAKQKAGETSSQASLESFEKFVKKKTEQIRKEYGCHTVEYSVEVHDGQVRLKAKAKTTA
jgi:hypothetical protein